MEILLVIIGLVCFYVFIWNLFLKIDNDDELIFWIALLYFFNDDNDD